MFPCPRCHLRLKKQRSPSLGFIWVCPSCHGRALTLELLRHVVPPALANRLWQGARAGEYATVRRCPACNRPMVEVPIVPAQDKTVCLDVCTGCHLVWFDTREFESLPQVPTKPPQAQALPPEAREALALAQIEAIRRESELAEASAPPDCWWQLVIGLTGVPIEYNDAPLKNRPVITWSLAGVILAIHLAVMSDLEDVVNSWGLIPAEFARYAGLTFVTSFFLHGGLFHLIGNLYFLLVFGDNTEDVLGKRRFAALVAAATIAGGILHVLADPRVTVPAIGASGGISGILAFYCLRFPAAKVGFVGRFYSYRISARLLLAVWVLTQIIDAFQVMRGIGNVGVFAHLGGAAVGVLFWWWNCRTISAPGQRMESS